MGGWRDGGGLVDTQTLLCLFLAQEQETSHPRRLGVGWGGGIGGCTVRYRAEQNSCVLCIDITLKINEPNTHEVLKPLEGDAYKVERRAECAAVRQLKHCRKYTDTISGS